MRYRLELILGQSVASKEFGRFLEALSEVSSAGRMLAGSHRVLSWQQEARPGRAIAWVREYDANGWASEGTPLFAALLALAGQPYATAWQVLGPAANHPDVGLRLLGQRTEGWIEFYRLP